MHDIQGCSLMIYSLYHYNINEHSCSKHTRMINTDTDIFVCVQVYVLINPVTYSHRSISKMSIWTPQLIIIIILQRMDWPIFLLFSIEFLSIYIVSIWI